MKLKPYTITGECNCEEDLRVNWRLNSNYHRKTADQSWKKFTEPD